MKHYFAILFLSILFPLGAFAQAGRLDSSFAKYDGYGFTNITSWLVGDFGDLEILQNGKILVASNIDDNQGQHVAIIKYHSNGIIDSSFSNDGIVYLTKGQNSLFFNVSSIDVQTDGKILLGGSADSMPNSPTQFSYIVRLLADGNIDASFGSNGQVIGQPSYNCKTLLLNDGKIISADGNFSEFRVTRYKDDGQLDSSFGKHGIGSAPFELAAWGGVVYDVKIQPDNKIVIGGSLGSPSAFGLARFNQNGTSDSSFGVNGIVITDISDTMQDHGYSLAIQPDDKILLGGAAYGATGPIQAVSDWALARYKKDGTLDSAFGNNGILITDFFGNDRESRVTNVLQQSDGKILQVGFAYSHDAITSPPFYPIVLAVSRHLISGQPDTTFGTKGKIYHMLGRRETKPFAASWQSNEAIVLSGTCLACIPDTNAYLPQFFISRMLTTPDLGILNFNEKPTLINIYPNPISNNVTIRYTLESEELIAIAIYDVQGRRVENIKMKAKNVGAHEETINTQKLPAGTYIIKIGNGKSDTSVKVVKQ